MATYLQGVTDYIPQIQPWKPDYNLYQNVLERKQAKYDRGWEQVNNVYSSILNAPMMRSQDIEKRDQFFKDVEGQIQQMSGVDLSLPQNVDAASQVFKPFYEDDNIVHDIAFTKKYQDEMQHSEYLRNCTDKEKCGNKYWEDGQRALQYKAQEYVNAADDQALRMRAPKYTNFVNAMDKYSNFVEEQGFKMEYEQREGKYMVKRVNGEGAVVPLMNFLQARFGDDPELKAFNQTKSYLQRKENPEKHIQQYELAMMQREAESPEQLKQMVEDRANKLRLEEATEVINETNTNAQTTVDRLGIQKATIENTINNEGIIKGGPEDKAYQSILDREDAAVSTAESVKQIASMTNNMSYTDSEGNVIPPETIDGVVANAMMMKDLNLAANTLAYKNYSVTKKADQFALAEVRHNFALETAAVKHAYTLETASVKNSFKEGEAYRKFLVDKGYINPFTGQPYYIDPTNQTMDMYPGGGMATGDPADLAAELRYKIQNGIPIDRPKSAVYKGGGSGGGVGTSSYMFATQGIDYKERKGQPGKTRAIEAMSEPIVYAKDKVAVAVQNFPNVLIGGKPAEPFTGFKPGQGVMKIDFAKSNTPDSRIQQVIGMGLDGDIDGTQVMHGFNKYIQPSKDIVASWGDQAARNQEFIVSNQVNSILTTASHQSDPYNGYAMDGMIGVGNMIKENLNNPEIKAQLQKSGSYNLLKEFPNSKSLTNLNPDYFKKLTDAGLTQDIMLAAGKRELFSKFTNKQSQQIVKSYSSDAMIDRDNIDIISKEEAFRLQQKQATAPDFLNSTGNTNFFGLGLTPDEAEALKKYDYYTTQPTVDNDFRSVGLNSPIPALRDFNNKQLTQMALTENMFKAANRSKENYVNQMSSHAGTYGKEFEGEGADFATKILAQNIWDSKTKDGWGKFTPLGNIYIKAAEAMVFEKGSPTMNEWDANMIKERSGFSHRGHIDNAPGIYDVLELEEEYTNGQEVFKGAALKNMITQSSFAKTYALPRNTDMEALQKTMGGNPLNLTKAKAWDMILDDPNTKIVRKGSKFKIESPYLTGNIQPTYNLDSFNVSKQYNGKFDDIEDKSGIMRAEFLNTAQNTEGKKISNTLMFPKVDASVSSNWNYDVPTMTGINAQAGKHDQQNAMVTKTLEEIAQKFDQPLTQYGFSGQQGDKALLDMAIAELSNQTLDYDPDNVMFQIEVDPVFGNMDVSKVTLRMHDLTKHKYAKSKGKTTYDQDEGYQYAAEMEDQVYYLPKGQSALIKNTQPDPFYTLAGLADGESYVDDMFWDEFGGKVEYKRVGDHVQVIPTYKVRDPQTGEFRNLKMVPATGPQSIPLKGTKWEDVFKLQYSNIYDIPTQNLDAELNLAKITSTDHYKK